MALTLGTNVGFVTVAPTADPAGTNTTIDGSSVVVKHTTPAGARKITQIGWYRGAGTNTANFEVALYADTAGAAGARLFVDNTNSSNAGGWITVAVDWNVSPSTSYWLGLQMDAHSGTSSVDSATPGGAGTDVLTSQTTLNDPYGGGAVADADGMYAIYGLVTLDKEVTPGVGALVLAGFAAVVSVSDHQNVTPGFGELSLTGFAPTVTVGVNVAPGTGELTITGFAPVVTATENQNIQPGFGELVLAGFAPTVAVTDHQTVLPGVGELALAGFAPMVTASDHKTVLPGAGELVFTGFAPTVDAGSGSGVEVLPCVGELTLTGFSPTIAVSVGVIVSISQNFYPRRRRT